MDKVLKIDLRDYSDKIQTIFFCVADSLNTIKTLENVDYIKTIEQVEDGFKLRICVQQIPEIIRFLSLKNIAVYAVIPLKN